jgi:hypothetical protein
MVLMLLRHDLLGGELRLTQNRLQTREFSIAHDPRMFFSVLRRAEAADFCPGGLIPSEYNYLS